MRAMIADDYTAISQAQKRLHGESWGWANAHRIEDEHHTEVIRIFTEADKAAMRAAVDAGYMGWDEYVVISAERKVDSAA